MGNFTAWILRAGTAGFTAGCKTLLPDVPHFGDLVLAHSSFSLFGLIYDVRYRDDLVVRQLALADALEPEQVLDQRENRLAPVELDILTVGYRVNGEIMQGLSPQPPLCLDTLRVCDEAEWRAFTVSLAYLHRVLATVQTPADELLATHLVRAAATYAPEGRYRFLVGAGRELARLLGGDLIRLERLLKRIKPGEAPG